MAPTCPYLRHSACGHTLDFGIKGFYFENSDVFKPLLKTIVNHYEPTIFRVSQQWFIVIDNGTLV